MDDNVYFCCEYARSSIGSCKACPKAIPKNAVKIGFTPDFDHCGTIWFHFSCFFKKCFFRKQLKDDTETESVFVGFKDLKETDQERIRKAREKLVLSLATGKAEAKKGKRTADDDESEWKPPTKKIKKSRTTTHLEKELTVGEHTYLIQDLLHINISRWRDIVLVGIREYYRPTTGGKLRPGKKGISLTVDQYRTLIDQKLSISKAIEQIKEDLERKEAIKQKKQKQKKKQNKKETAKTDFDISENRRIIVKSEFISGSQQVVVDIREYSTPTEQSGEIPLPTDKGINLTEEQWNTLLSLHLTVIRDLADNFGYSEDFADQLSE
ncbi:poly [ADP-ribose] polymerase 1-like isoform X2 [Mytilus edulis]|uniref:poly [ADP-ribose] polymerase 1-like isoform X2 n=1 Tax=Mytilus edulis TaxID=6550 RepID=UPI0039EE5689